jgi:hypothetical protein
MVDKTKPYKQINSLSFKNIYNDSFCFLRELENLAWILMTEVTTGMITNIALITFAVGLTAVQATRTIMTIYIVWQQIRRR